MFNTYFQIPHEKIYSKKEKKLQKKQLTKL